MISGCPTLGRSDAPSNGVWIAPYPPPGVAALGPECSLGDLLQDDPVDRKRGHRLRQPSVLGLELAQALGLVNAQPAVTLAPEKAGLVGDPKLLADLGDRLALAGQDIGLAQLVDDLFSRKPLFRHGPLSSVPQF